MLSHSPGVNLTNHKGLVDCKPFAQAHVALCFELNVIGLSAMEIMVGFFLVREASLRRWYRRI